MKEIHTVIQLMTGKEFAAFLKCSPQYVSKLKAAGRLVMRRGLIDVHDSLDLMRQTADPSRYIYREKEPWWLDDV